MFLSCDCTSGTFRVRFARMKAYARCTECQEEYELGSTARETRRVRNASR